MPRKKIPAGLNAHTSIRCGRDTSKCKDFIFEHFKKKIVVENKLKILCESKKLRCFRWGGRRTCAFRRMHHDTEGRC